jgi:hypothetical protein
MRRVVFVALLVGSLLNGLAEAQSTEQGATEPKPAPPPPRHTSNPALFENGPPSKNASRGGSSRHTPEAESAPEPVPATPPPPPVAPAMPTVQAAPPGPPQKNLTGDEFRQIHVGSSAKEVLAALGPPSSRVVVPDDDGHLRESLQYWAKGAPMGTVRLDNGRVVQIETRSR